MYKTLTSVVSAKISQHIADNSVTSGAQNGCKVVVRSSSSSTRPLANLSNATVGIFCFPENPAVWIDYRKAFDSVPHSWRSRVFELYKIDSAVRHFLGQCMGDWRTILTLDGRRMTDDGWG
ncbi:uncharacterized protein LOC113238883 [Hyposmocoma kahamanoa]|uniref:uncharacterized protein LOC113238883 n=1 Tax=Hyposmocoma kahamanoa TaxID=1477025 RepID=UPI000E6D69F0|nr:uncharacterized protein LOC113238883 [Hyposmocoma kahamanoa]